MKNPKFYTGNIVPEENTIFVFGSNPQGIHGAGSAKVAQIYFCAIYGQGEGLQGSSYGLPTTNLNFGDNRLPACKRGMSQEEIIGYIKNMYKCAVEHPDKNFKVAYRNRPYEATICGYTGAEMISMFKTATEDFGGEIPDNVWFSKEWVSTGLFENEKATE